MQKQSYSASSANTAEEKVSAKSDCVRNAQNITSEETRTQKQEEYEIPITRSEESEEASIKKGVRSSQNILSEETKTQRQEEFQIPIVMSEQEADSTKAQSAESDSCQFSESRKVRKIKTSILAYKSELLTMWNARYKICISIHFRQERLRTKKS